MYLELKLHKPILYKFTSHFIFTKKKKAFYRKLGDFLGGPVVKNMPCNAGDIGSIPGWGAKIPPAVDQHHR